MIEAASSLHAFGEEQRRIVRDLAKEGLGYEDIIVRMSRQDGWRVEWREIVKAMVLGQRALERKAAP